MSCSHGPAPQTHHLPPSPPPPLPSRAASASTDPPVVRLRCARAGAHGGRRDGRVPGVPCGRLDPPMHQVELPGLRRHSAHPCLSEPPPPRLSRQRPRSHIALPPWLGSGGSALPSGAESAAAPPLCSGLVYFGTTGPSLLWCAPAPQRLVEALPGFFRSAVAASRAVPLPALAPLAVAVRTPLP